MTVWDELKARGLIAQVTDEEEIKEMVNNGKATFYIGFDPTADSLHVGHFMALCLMKRLQMAAVKVGGPAKNSGMLAAIMVVLSVISPKEVMSACALSKPCSLFFSTL